VRVAAAGPVEVTAVETQGVGSSGAVLLIAADGPIGQYEAFTLPDPPRLVVNIQNATHAIRQPITPRPPLVTAIRSSQYREQPVKIVRVVADLRSAVPYQVAAVDNQLQVQLGTAVGSEPVPAAKAPVVGAKGKVTGVDLQSVRGRQRILIRTSSKLPYTVSEVASPPSLVVDIAGAQIDPADARTLDLRQVTSPLNRLQAAQHATDPEPVVRVTADLRAPIRYDVQQTAQGIVVEILGGAATGPGAPTPVAAPAAPAGMPAAAAAPGAATGPPAAPGTGRLSMDFKDADINNLLRIIAEVSGMNVIAGDDVRGKVTVRLVNVEWQQALDVILKINNLGYEIDGNVIRVAPLAKLQAERRAREEARVAAARAKETEKQVEVKLEPLVSKVLPVNYAKAADVVNRQEPRSAEDAGTAGCQYRGG
jgi:type IV pilus assembly protein PilQ